MLASVISLIKSDWEFFREELVHIKQGEENKKKMYRAVCVTDRPVSVDLLSKLNISKEFTIEQMTPIRVLHRRPWRNRQRTVYEVKASINKGEILKPERRTQKHRSNNDRVKTTGELREMMIWQPSCHVIISLPGNSLDGFLRDGTSLHNFLGFHHFDHCLSS